MGNLVPLEEFMGGAQPQPAGMVPLEEFGGAVEKEDPAAYALKVFQAHGWSREQAAAIVGNLMHESGLKTTIEGDGGASVGLAQWNGERRKGLEAFARSRGMDWRDFNTQLDYVNHELQSTEAAAGQVLNGATDVDSATRIFSEHYERPGKPMMQSRLAQARKLYDPEGYRHIEQGEFMEVAGAADLGFGLSPVYEAQPGELYRKVRGYLGLDQEPWRPSPVLQEIGREFVRTPPDLTPETPEELLRNMTPEELRFGTARGLALEDIGGAYYEAMRTREINEGELRRVMGRFVDGYTSGLTEGAKKAAFGDVFKPETPWGTFAGEGAYLAGQILGPFKLIKWLTGSYLFPSVSGLRTTGQILTRGMKEGAVNLGILQGLSRIVPAMIEHEDAERWALDILSSAKSGALVGAAFPMLSLVPGQGAVGTGLRMATGFAALDYMRAAPGKWSTLGDFYHAYQAWDPESKKQFASLSYQYLLDLYFARTVRPIRETLAAYNQREILREMAKLNPQELEKEILGVTRGTWAYGPEGEIIGKGEMRTAEPEKPVNQGQVAVALRRATELYGAPFDEGLNDRISQAVTEYLNKPGIITSGETAGPRTIVTPQTVREINPEIPETIEIITPPELTGKGGRVPEEIIKEWQAFQRTEFGRNRELQLAQIRAEYPGITDTQANLVLEERGFGTGKSTQTPTTSQAAPGPGAATIPQAPTAAPQGPQPGEARPEETGREAPQRAQRPLEGMGSGLLGEPGPKKLYAGVPGPETSEILARLKEGIREARSLWADLKANIREVVAPGTLSGAREVAKGLITMMGRKNEAISQAHFRLLEFRDLFKKTPVAEWAKLAATWQAGGKTGTDLDRAWEVYHEISDALVPRVRDFRDLAYQENYLRQAWRNTRDPEFKTNIGKFLEGKPFKNYLDLDENGNPRLYKAAFAEDGSYTLERQEGVGEPAAIVEERPKPLTSVPRGRTLTGGRGYFKKKVIPDWQTGLMLGGIPKFKNLFDLMIWDIGEKNQFVWGNAFISWAREEGYLQYVSARAIPQGWARINDPRGLINHPYLKEVEAETRPFEQVPEDYDMTAAPKTEARVMEWALVAPQEAARIINNFLSPGLWGQPVYNLYRRVVDPLRRLGVSFSTFHLRFTMNNSLATGTGHAVSKFMGDLFSGDLEGAAKAVKSGSVNLTGAPFIRDLQTGKALTEAFYKGTEDPVLQDTLRRFIDTGGTLPAPEAMLPMIRETAKGVWQSLVELGRVHPFRAVGELAEASSKPIMTYAVPFAKLGAFPVLDRALQDRLEAKYAKMGPETPEQAAQREAEYRQGLFDINKHLDNIYGQMNYDALLLNRKIKDLLFFVIKFPGWNIGSGRWLAGKISGLRKIATGQEVTEYERESLRSGLGFVINMGIYSTLLYWFINGRPPEDMGELYSKGVWTGGYTRSGNKEYIRDASYWRDLWGMFPIGQHGELEPGKPIETVKVKAADIWRVPVEVFDNKEAYSGYQIFTPGEPSRWAEEGLKYLGKQAIPYSFRGMAQAYSPWGKFGSFVGWTPTPTRLTDTPAMQEMRRHRVAQSPRIVTTIKQEGREIKKNLMDFAFEGDGPGFLAGLRQARAEGEITSTQYKGMVRDGHEILRDPHYGPLRNSFRKLTDLGVAIKVFGLAIPEEREALADLMQQKWGRARPETRRRYREEFLELKEKVAIGE